MTTFEHDFADQDFTKEERIKIIVSPDSNVVCIAIKHMAGTKICSYEERFTLDELIIKLTHECDYPNDW